METLSLSDPTWHLRMRWYNKVWHRKSELNQYLIKQVQASSSNLKQPQATSIKFIHSKNTFQEYISKNLSTIYSPKPFFLFIIRLLDQHNDIWESGSKYWCKAETKLVRIFLQLQFNSRRLLKIIGYLILLYHQAFPC